jgi:hypothetical protein
MAIPRRIWLLVSVLTTRTGRHGGWWGECGEMVALISGNRVSRKFALMEYSEIRVRQDRYFRLYEP